MPLSPHRRGYGLVWAVVVIAIVATIAAAAAPVIGSVVDQQRVSDTYATLRSVDSAIVKFGASVQRVGVVYPLKIHSLSKLVLQTERISCGTNTYNPNSQTTWTANGPFGTFYADTSLATPLGTLDDSIEHATATSPIFIRIKAVDTALVNRMDRLVDAGDGGAAGTIRYVLPAAGTETMDLVYRVGFAPNYTLTAVC
ncbi:MAG: hypothetical protein JWM41_1597 [Gemmatimonadetes bacterium]|nr:hypothetical protein [Gemmatimonadota bacterium]